MANEFRAGVATVDISPDRPDLLFLGALHQTEKTRGVMPGNPLEVCAMAFEAGGRKAVVAVRDTGGYGYRNELAVRKLVAERTGLDERRVIVTATHNHSCGARPADREDPASSAAARRFWEGINRGTVEACVRAVEDLRPAEMAGGTVHLTEPVGQCRRARFAHGGSMPSWGAGPVAIPGERFGPPPGPDSTRIDFLCVREPGTERPFGILTAYASHIHLAGIPYFNGEVAGAVRAAIRRHVPGATALYATTTGGDLDMHCVHPMPPGDVEDRLRWYAESADTLSRRFCDALVPAIPRSGYVRPAGMAHEYVETEGHETNRRKRHFLVNAIRLGPVAIASIPAEMFLELVNRVRDASPVRHLLLMGFNGSSWLGYIGTPLAYEQGGYEMGKGPAPSPEEEQRLIARGERSRMIGKARIDTGVEIARTAADLLRRLGS